MNDFAMPFLRDSIDISTCSFQNGNINNLLEAFPQKHGKRNINRLAIEVAIRTSTL
jgi:hypothetical protein